MLNNDLSYVQLCRNSHLVRSIKEVNKIEKSHNCNKLRKGNPKFVIPSSYIVMIKPHNNMPEMVSASWTALFARILAM